MFQKWGIILCNPLMYNPLPSALFFRLHHVACSILVPWPGIEPRPPALKAQNLNNWTTREALFFIFLMKLLENLKVHMQLIFLLESAALEDSPCALTHSYPLSVHLQFILLWWHQYRGSWKKICNDKLQDHHQRGVFPQKSIYSSKAVCYSTFWDFVSI